MSRVPIKRDVLRWAISRSGRTTQKLSNRFPRIDDWLKGDSHPTLRQIESLAKATSTPLGYLFLDEPPDEVLPIPHFRTVSAEAPYGPSTELLETVQIMQRRQAWMRDFLLEQGASPVALVASAKMRENSQRIAESIRQALGFGLDWASKCSTWTKALEALREASESAGILVTVNGIVGNNTHRQLSVEEFRGFVLVDDFAPLVFVNGADGKAAQMFTLAHELAHVALGKSAAFDLRRLEPAENAIEQTCNAVAAEFLVPETLMREMWPQIPASPKRWQVLARKFKVSEIVIARRALDLNLISKSKFFKFYQEYIEELRESSRSTSGGDFYATQSNRLSKRFANAVIQSAREGTLLYSEAYKLTGLYGKTFHQYAERLRLGV